MRIKIVDFAKERGLKDNTVNSWILRHDEVKKDCWFEGKTQFIDDESEGYKILDAMYPLHSTEIVTNDQVLKYVDALEKINALEAELRMVREKLHEKELIEAREESTSLLLEAESSARKEAEERAEQYRVQAEQERAAKVSAEADVKLAAERLEDTKAILQKETERADAAEHRVETLEMSVKNVAEETQIAVREKNEEMQKNAELQEKIEKMKNASFWQRLTGKWD